MLTYDFGYITTDAVCRSEVYTVENPTNNPFPGIKFEFAYDDNDGDGVKMGLSDLFRFTLDQAN